MELIIWYGLLIFVGYQAGKLARISYDKSTKM